MKIAIAGLIAVVSLAGCVAVPVAEPVPAPGYYHYAPPPTVFFGFHHHGGYHHRGHRHHHRGHRHHHRR
jgi:hypothetical protein